MMQIRGVIFDFDGVVVDSLSTHLKAWSEACHRLFGADIPEPLRLTLPGRSTQAIADILSRHFRKPGFSAELANLKREILTAQRLGIDLLPGARAVMEFLTKAGVPYGIASNAPRDFVRATVASHALSVSVVLGVEDAARPKPAPDLFLACAQRLRLPHTVHRSVVVFEDSLHGLQAAKDAGMYPVGLMTQHGSQDLVGAGAKLAFRNLQDALDRSFFSGSAPLVGADPN